MKERKNESEDFRARKAFGIILIAIGITMIFFAIMNSTYNVAEKSSLRIRIQFFSCIGLTIAGGLFFMEGFATMKIKDRKSIYSMFPEKARKFLASLIPEKKNEKEYKENNKENN